MKYRLSFCSLIIVFIATAAVHSQELHAISSNAYVLSTNEGRSLMKGNTIDLSLLQISMVSIGTKENLRIARNDSVEQLIFVHSGAVIFGKGNDKIIPAGSVAWIAPGDELTINNPGSGFVTCFILEYRSKLPQNNKRGQLAGGSFNINWDNVAPKPTDKGERREFFDHATAMFERFEMHVTTLNKKDEISHPPHTHRAEEIVFVVKGKVEMTIADNHIKAERGAMIFLESEVSHALKNISDGPCTYFAFQWQPVK